MAVNIFEAISKLRAVRKYQDRKVDEKIIGLILYSATHAISAGNLQPWEFVVVDDAETKRKLASMLKLEHVAKAPVCIVVGADMQKVALKYGKQKELVCAVEDAMQASQIILLTATALGLGTDLVRTFEKDEINLLLGFPENIKAVTLITLGYPDEEGEERQIVPFENLTHLNRYGNKGTVKEGALQEIFDKIFAELKRRTHEKFKKRFSTQFLKSKLAI